MLHNLPVLDAAPVLVPLEDVLPLDCLLTTVATAKQRMAQVRCGEACLPFRLLGSLCSHVGSSMARQGTICGDQAD